MSKSRRIGLFAALLALGAGATLAQLMGGDVPKSLDPAAWLAWFEADMVKSGALVFTSLATGIGFVGTLLGIFAPTPVAKKDLKTALEPVATKADLAGMEARFMAKLASERAPDAPPSDAAVLAAQTEAVSNVLVSTNPLDAKAYDAVARGDVDGAIAAMLEAADADRDQAARRYREAGALAYERNVLQAIDAYEKAAALDPGDFRTWVFLSRLYLAAGQVRNAEARARSALLAAHDPRERYVALIAVGDVLVTRGDSGGALRSFRDGHDIVCILADADPGNAEAKRDLYVSLSKIGDVMVTRGDFDGALKSFHDGFDIARKLADADPTNAGAQRDLYVGLIKIGDVLVTRGDLDGALKSFREALDIARTLADADPGNAEAQRDLSVSLNKIGNVLAAQGDTDGALKSFQDGLAIRRKLADADPSNAQAQRDRSVSLHNVGDVLATRGDFDGGLQSFHDGLAILRKLADTDPGNAQAQRDVSISYDRIGNVQVTRGDHDGALKSFQDGLAIRRELTNADPANVVAQRDVCASLMAIGDVLARREDHSGAGAAYREGFDIAHLLAEADPGNVGAQLDLGLFLARLAATSEALGDAVEALRLFQEAKALFEWVCEAAPDLADAKHMAEVSAEHAARLSPPEADLL